MQKFIDFNLTYRQNLYPNAAEVIANMFTTIGNGIKLNHKLQIPDNYGGTDPYIFSDPVPIKNLYPWTDNISCQPFRKYVGCKTPGFKEAVDYFIKCLEITPTTQRSKPWKDNVSLIKEVLSAVVTLPEYDKDDTSSLLNTLSGKATNNPDIISVFSKAGTSVNKIWFFDVQWSDCPIEVESEVKHIWSNCEYGNDDYVYKTELNDDLFDDYPKVYLWLKFKGVQENEKVLINWWW